MVKPRAKARKLLTRFKIGKRVYELVPFFKKGEYYISGREMIRRAKKLKSNLGKKDGAFILKHHHEIPEEFQGEFFLVFTAWRRPSSPPRGVAYLYWSGRLWYRDWGWSDDDWIEGNVLVRRIK